MPRKFDNVWYYGGVNAELHATNKRVNVTSAVKLSAEAAHKMGIEIPSVDSKGQTGVDFVVVQGLKSSSRGEG